MTEPAPPPSPPPGRIEVETNFEAPENMVIISVNDLPVSPPVLVLKGTKVRLALKAAYVLPPTNLILEGWVLRSLADMPGVHSVEPLDFLPAPGV